MCNNNWCGKCIPNYVCKKVYTLYTKLGKLYFCSQNCLDKYNNKIIG